jgi:hypothetical protein
VQLKNIVIDLSVDVWHNYINQQKDIASLWIEQIKKKNNFYVADSTFFAGNNGLYVRFFNSQLQGLYASCIVKINDCFSQTKRALLKHPYKHKT